MHFSSSRSSVLLLLLAVCCIPSFITHADDIALDNVHTPQDFTTDILAQLPNAQFGDSVAMHGDWLIAGAPGVADSAGEASVYQKVSGVWTLRTTLRDPNSQAGAAFGAAVDIYENGGILTIIVGAPLHDAAQTDEGRAVVFWGAYTALNTRSMTPSTPTANGQFGSSVSIYGDTAAIGAPNHGVSHDGEVSIHTRNQGGADEWGLLMTKAGTPGSAFGTSVDIDGEYLIVGAPYAENHLQLTTGLAYVYRQDLGGPQQWGLKHTLFVAPSEQNDMAFGFAVAIWDENPAVANSTSRSVIGAPLHDFSGTEDSGLVAFFINGTVNTTAAGGMAKGNRGYSVDIYGDYAVVGAPGVTMNQNARAGSVTMYSYEEQTFLPMYANTFGHPGGNRQDYRYGHAVALHGVNAAVGTPGLSSSPGVPRQGNVVPLELIAGTWTSSLPITLDLMVDLPTVSENQGFGYSIDATDTWLAIGTPGDPQRGFNGGAVYMYRNVGGVWTPHSKLTALYGVPGDRFGMSVAIDGDKLFVGAPYAAAFPTPSNYSGMVYRFSWNGSEWQQDLERAAPTPELITAFGHSLDVQGDVLVVAARENGSGDGLAFAYRDLMTLSDPVSLVAPLGVPTGYFGRTVAAYDPSPGTAYDETVAVTLLENTSSGHVILYSGASFENTTVLSSPTSGPDSFGAKLSMSHGRIAIGAPSGIGSAPNSGVVYIYSGPNYGTLEATLPGLNTGDGFGVSVELNDTMLLVGHIKTTTTGRASVFSRTGATWSAVDTVTVDSADDNWFGLDVAMGGGRFFVAAAMDDSAAENLGAVYEFSIAPSINVVPTTLSVAEEGETTDTFVVSLNQVPSGPVTIQLTFDGNVMVDTGSGYGASPQTITLPASEDAVTGITVSVRAVDDGIDEADPHTITITTGATSSSDTRFSGITVDDVTVEIADNDAAGVTVAPTTLNIAEGGAPGSYDVSLNSEPTGTVTVTIAFDELQVTVNGETDGSAELTFNSGNWSSAQSVTVEAVEDLLFEAATHSTTLTHTVTGDGYDDVTAADVNVSITENDFRSIEFVTDFGNVSETAGTYDAMVRLNLVTNGVPGGTLSDAITAEVTLASSSAVQYDDFMSLGAPFSFPAGTAHGATKAYTVSIINDRLLEGEESFSITLIIYDNSGTVGPQGTHYVTIEDDETGTLTFSHTLVTLSEGDPTWTMTAKLVIDGTGSGDFQVGAPFSIELTGSNGPELIGDYTIDTPTLTFPTGVGSPLYQPVEITVVDDRIVEGTESIEIRFDTFGLLTYIHDQITAYNTLLVTINDNDSASVALSSGDDTVREDVGYYQKNAVLTIAAFGTGPVGLRQDFEVPVSLTYNTADASDASLVTTMLVFAADSLSGATEIITVNIHDDDIDEDDETFTLEISNDNLPIIALDRASTIVTIEDNDTGGVRLIDADDMALAEDISDGPNMDTYSIALSSQPLGDVTITVLYDETQVNINGDYDGSLELTFTTSNWSEPQGLVVITVNDLAVEGPHTTSIQHSVASTDSLYDGATVPDVVVNITDNDTAEIVFSPGPPTVLNETVGAALAVLARLKVTANGVVSAPGSTLGADVTIGSQITFDTASADDITVQDGTLVLPAGTGNDALFVAYYLRSVNDRLFEQTETFSLSLTIDSGPATTTAVQEFEIYSDEQVTVTFAFSGGSTPEDSTPYETSAVIGIAGTGTGPLAIASAFDVPIIQTPITATTPDDYTLTTTSITIASGTLAGATIPINVAIVDDAYIESPETFSLSFGAVSGVNGVAASDVHIVTIVSDDVAGLVITESGGSTDVTEGSGSDTFTVSLTAQPIVPVDIGFMVGTQTVFTPYVFIIEPENWNVPHEVMVMAVDDLVIEGDHSETVGIIVTGDIQFMSNIAPNTYSVQVNITDNDVPGIAITESDGSTAVAEGGATDTYSVVLLGAPTQNVIVQIDSLPQLSTSPTSLTFTPANYNIPQTVTVSAVIDGVLEGPHSATITHTVISDDPNYNGIPADSVNVLITDGVIEMLANGSFEIAAAKEKRAESWKIVGKTSKDRRLCETVTDPDIAYEGDCVYQFKFNGPLNAGRKLVQKIKNPIWGMPGVTLTASAQVSGQNFASGAKLILKVKYTDNQVEKVKINIPTGTYDYTLLTTPTLNVTKPVKQVAVIFNIGTAVGRVWLDDASLILASAETRSLTPRGALPLPDAPPLPDSMRRHD